VSEGSSNIFGENNTLQLHVDENGCWSLDNNNNDEATLLL